MYIVFKTLEYVRQSTVAKSWGQGKIGSFFWRQIFIELCANIHLNMSKNDM